MLVWLILFYQVAARDIPLQSTYVTKYIEKCPEQGYFFKRDLQGVNSETCYLCFCKGNNSAICWQRNNKKCDEESYQHNWAKKRVSRNRRSPISFGDLFMRDATKAVFNAQDQRTCKPNEASYSEGCPPLDWCVGCTVCDCNSNGKWDCHLLSFCTNDNNKNSKNKNYKGELQGKFYDPFTTPRTRRAERIKAQHAVKDLAEKMAQARQKKKIGKSNTRRYLFKNGTLVNKTIFDLRKRKKSPTILNQSSAEVHKWSNINMKIRKIPDQITRQILIDKQKNNSKKVSESANFFVRKMPNKKSRKILDQKHSQAVNVLAKRQPNRKKKRQVILPSGFKLPKELLAKLPPGVIPPTRDPPGEHFPKTSHVKRVLPNQVAATKPPRQTIVKRSLELSPDITDRKLVKRSTKFDDVTKKKTKRRDKNAHGRRKLPIAKPSSKSLNLFKKKVTGFKENVKKRSLNISNSKILKKSYSKNNNHVDNKNNQQKNSNRKKSKDKTKDKNKSKNKNGHSKNKNSVKNIPNNLKKSLKSNANQNQNHQNARKNTVSKNNHIKNEELKKSLKRNSGTNVKREIKNKKGNNNNHKKNKDIVKDKSKTTKKPLKKEVNKPPKDILNKKSVKAGYTRGKRSDPEAWIKTVTEGNKVTKYAFKTDHEIKQRSEIKKDHEINKRSNNTKTSKTSNPNCLTAEQMRRSMINEEVKKIAGTIQSNLNRKVLEAVGKMLGQNLTQQSKIVKRSAVLETEAVHETETDDVNDSGIDFMTLNPGTLNQRAKRSPNNDEGYNESRHIPFIVKKRPLPPVKHIEKREVHLNQFQELQFTSSIRPANQTRVAFDELDKYLESVTRTTPVYLTTDMKRSVPPSKPEETGDSDLIDIHIPIKKISRNIVNDDDVPANSVPTKNYRDGLGSKNISKLTMVVSPLNKFKRSAPVMEKVMTQKIKHNERRVRSIKKSQNVDKFDQVMVNRHKRKTDIEEPVTNSLQHFENEVLTNSSHDNRDLISQNKSGTTDSIFKYYKYSVDDYLDTNTEQTVKNYLTEVVEVYTKNMAAKRSVDKQIERLTNVDVVQIKNSDPYNETVPVQGLADNNKEYTTMILQLKENNTVSGDDDKLKVHAAEPLSFKSTNVLDDKVVIIQDQNVSSIERISELTTYPLPNPTVSTASEPRLINKTVIGIKFQENQQIENMTKNDKLHNIIPSESIDKSSTLVDKSVVIIHDQNITTMPTTSSYLSATTKYKIEPKISDTTNTLISKEPFFMIVTDRNKIIGSKKEIPEPLSQPTTNTSFKVIDEAVRVAEKSTEKKIQSTDIVKNDTYLVITENEFKPQMTTNILNEERNKYLLKLTTESNIKSQYGTDNNVTKQDMSVIDIGSKESEVISTTVKATTEQIKLSTFKPILKNYLKYDVDTNTYDLKQNLIKPRKYKKVIKLMNQVNMTMNSTEKSKYRIDDYVAIVVQKDPHTKPQKNHTEANNDTVLTTDLRIKNYNILTTTKSNFIKQDNRTANSTIKSKEYDFTTKFSDDIHSTKVLSLLQDKIFKNLSKTNAEINKVKSYDMKKISVKKAKKNRLKKILSTLHNRTNKDERYLINNIVKHQKNINKTNDLKSFFKKLLSNFKFNKHVRKPSNAKRFKILKYLQKFFKKIFSDDGKHKKNKTLAHQLNRRNVIETLCTSFGPCNINVKNKAKLQSQINHLNSETYKMLRSVKIIKGLLKLVDMAGNDKKLTNGTSLKAKFKSDVQKLHAILRDTYSNSEQMDTLTDTQKIQIQYIKNSTQNFIQSAAKFTMVLNEIINMITLPDHQRINDDGNKPKVKMIEKPDIRKIFKSRNINKTVTATESNESLQKLKELISKYSLIQNTFMRKIYNVLTNLDSGKSTQKKNRAIDATINKKSEQQQNKTVEIQVYTKNIIQNLRKLKNLAQNLNEDTGMGHVRRKRDLRNDDSLEYMLMLMEYLIKQQHPLDDAPVSDGIDLLIDAIKSAPDIKSIKKKVLPMYNHPNKLIFKAKNTSNSSESLEEKRPKGSSSSESDIEPSREINVTSSNLEEQKFNVIDQSIDDDADEQDYYMYNRRANLPTTEEFPTSTESHPKAKWHEHVTTDTYYNTISDTDVPNKSKLSGNNHKHAKKVTNFDFFNRYVDEDVQTTITASEIDYTPDYTASEASTIIDLTTKLTESTPLTQMRRNNNDDVSASKSRIDWLDETYEEEIKESHRTTSAPVKKHMQLKKVTKATKKINTTKPTTSIDISGLSKEEETPSNKSTISKDIFYKKEISLLNSLDYGTEKTDMDVSASRESGAIDKYSGDAFSNYFREEKV